MEKVSIIIPVYNCEEKLERCIKSIEKQQYENLEIILIDDGSTDGSGSICDSYRDSDLRVRVFHQENSGVSAARNKGIDNINGKYVTFIDADDWIAENYISRMYDLAIQNDAEIVMCNYRMVKEEECQFEQKSETRIISGRDAVKMQFEKAFLATSPWCKLIRTDVIGDIRFPVGRSYAEDLATMYKIFYQAKKVVVDKSVMYAYYQSAESVMHRAFNKEKLEEPLAGYAERRDYFEKVGDTGLRNMSLRSYYNRLVRAYCLVNYHVQMKDKEAVLAELNIRINTTYRDVRKIGKYEDISSDKTILLRGKLFIGRYCRRIFDLLFIKIPPNNNIVV
ncbi:MAG: glycosyltransferase [Butyrivibrio sp.]|nr:glycosyltransferase [Butyrivibrio sp.]